MKSETEEGKVDQPEKRHKPKRSGIGYGTLTLMVFVVVLVLLRSCTI